MNAALARRKCGAKLDSAKDLTTKKKEQENSRLAVGRIWDLAGSVGTFVRGCQASSFGNACTSFSNVFHVTMYLLT